MSNYTKATNFATKDGLTTGDPAKVVKGTEIDTEFTAIASAISSKSDSNSPTFTGTPAAPTASAGTNTTQIATTAFVAAAVSLSIPSGGIIIWSGAANAIPSGWYLCNGSNSTPDLRNRFVIGAGSTYSVAANGGSKDAIVVSHTHSLTATTGSGGSHSHYVTNGESFGNDGTSSAEETINLADGLGGNVNQYILTTSNNTADFARSSTIADHTHSISGTTDSAGSSGTDANLPPYYALCYIMKA
jgi:hypothetical protein